MHGVGYLALVCAQHIFKDCVVIQQLAGVYYFLFVCALKRYQWRIKIAGELKVRLIMTQGRYPPVLK